MPESQVERTENLARKGLTMEKVSKLKEDMDLVKKYVMVCAKHLLSNTVTHICIRRPHAKGGLASSPKSVRWLTARANILEAMVGLIFSSTINH